MSDFDAFILVGGRSSRMGRDKANVLFEGSPMIARITQAIRAALVDVRIRLVAADAEQIVRIDGFEPADGFVLDLYKDRGPAGGLYTALANSEKEWAFVVACDLPRISPELIDLLAQQIRMGVDAVVPVQPDGRDQPLAAFYRVKTVRERVTELFDRPRPTPSMRYVIDGLCVCRVPFDEIRHLEHSYELFRNINSLTDL